VRELADAGAGHDHRGSAEILGGRRHGRFHGRRITDVDLVAARAPADVARRLRDGVADQVEARDRATFAGNARRNGAPETRSRTGDDGVAAYETLRGFAHSARQ